MRAVFTDETTIRRAIADGIADGIRAALRELRLPVDDDDAHDNRERPLTTYIYALCEPGTDVIRYIGKANDPEQRLAQHVYHSWYRVEWENGRADSPKEAWIRTLRHRGEQPTMKIMEEVPRAESREHERKWIRWAVEQGYDLTNVANP